MRTLAPSVTPGPRSDILQCVREHPGIHLRAIERATALPLGQVLYHLDRLERMGLLASSRDAGFRRYYVTREVPRSEKPLLAALWHDVPREIVATLLGSPDLGHKELREVLGIAGSTLSFHLQRLVASGVLRREGRLYALAEPALAERLLTLRAVNQPTLSLAIAPERVEVGQDWL